jgi:hypothetical protein
MDPSILDSVYEDFVRDVEVDDEIDGLVVFAESV